MTSSSSYNLHIILHPGFHFLAGAKCEKAVFFQLLHKSVSVLKSLLSFDAGAANQWMKKNFKLQEGVKIAVTSGFISQEQKKKANINRIVNSETKACSQEFCLLF